MRSTREDEIPLKNQKSVTARWGRKVRGTRAWQFVNPAYLLLRQVIGLRKPVAKPVPGPIVRSDRPDPAPAYELEMKLWGGFSQYAIRDLEGLKRESSASPNVRSWAAWYLARWHIYRLEYERALENAVFMRETYRSRFNRKQQVLLESRCLLYLGHQAEARRILETQLKERPTDVDYCLAYANLWAPSAGVPDSPENDAIRLEWINKVFLRSQLAPVAKLDAEGPLAIHNLCVPAAVAVNGHDLPKISVIVPVRNSERTIEFALRGIREQTWRNIEVLVIDDCSSDGTLDKVLAVAELDERVIPLRHKTNQGAYAARNTALAHASGQLITTHDGDDWSHSQKLEAHAMSVLSNPGMVSSLSWWARVTERLEFTGPWLPRHRLMQMNYSSFLFTRELLDALGRWDYVRVSADTEFIWRARKIYGGLARGRAGSGAPLSFSLVDPNSLTQFSPTHLRTQRYGLRREYWESAMWWHDNVSQPANFRLPLDSHERPFPAPGAMLSTRVEPKDYEFVIIADFNLVGEVFDNAYNYLLSAIQTGKPVAVFHWPWYELEPGHRPLQPLMRALAFERKIDVLIPGQEVSAKTIIFGHPAMLQHRIDDAPKIKFQNLVVIVNQPASGGGDTGRPAYDPLQVRENLSNVFGSEGTWVPTSPLFRRLMARDGRYPRPHYQDWMPLVDTLRWCRKPLRWRGKERERPVVGRHGRDHRQLWPASRRALRAAYLADRPCEVRILGGAESTLKALRKYPANWSILSFESENPLEFLEALDFFVHYPDEAHIEESLRCVIEAMAAGVPVILPKAFRETFGDAAVYADPAVVWRRVQKLWSDEQAYLERAKIGRDFVTSNCRLERFIDQVESLTTQSQRM